MNTSCRLRSLIATTPPIPTRVILAVLNAVGVDVREIASVVSNPFLLDFPGATGDADGTMGAPTLLGSSDGSRPELIAAWVNLEGSVVLLGRDTIDDVLIGTPDADRFYGEQHDSAQTIDTVSYERSDDPVTVDLAAGAGQDGHADGDLYFGIENVVGSAHLARISHRV